MLKYIKYVKDIKISLKRKIFSLRSHWQSVAKLTMLPRGSKMSPAVTFIVNTVTVIGDPVFLKGAIHSVIIKFTFIA